MGIVGGCKWAYFCTVLTTLIILNPMKTILRYSLLTLFLVLGATVHAAQQKGMVSGKVLSIEKEVVDFATVYLKGTHYGSTTNQQGIYHLTAPAGTYTLVVSAVGYQTIEQQVVLTSGSRSKQNVVIRPQVTELDEVVVVSSAVGRIKQSAYNAIAIDAKSLHNSTQDLATALTKVPGVKLRESGGVGSDMQFSLDGFTGKHIKLFIDGVPQEGVGSSFGLNNIPVNFAERIEVYRGVVPVGFGADALGGVVNIVTGNKRKFFVDASYSYGSFNTHKSYLNLGQTFKNGWMYELNAFQNYSDNSYSIDTPVKDLSNGQIDKLKLESVKRFHDGYHNEAVIGKVGLVGKSFADRLVLGFAYSNSDKEIQTGVRQEIVFGQKRRKNHSFMPSLEYRKRNLFTQGLTVALTANYNRNLTQNLDTATYVYNWRGESIYNKGKLGEQNYQDARYTNDNWNGTFTTDYRIDDRQSIVLNHVLTSFIRKTASSTGIADNSAVAAAFDKVSTKNITGLSYRYSHNDRWNLSLFGKYYNQYSSGPRNASTSGGFDYVSFSESVSAFGYGAAATYFILDGLQAKASYEKAYRLPTTDELFGDDDLELGAMGLKPENSDNLNLNLSYTRDFGRHSLYVEGGYIYRDTKDYIRRTINSYSGGLYYGLYENHGRVKTNGFNVELRYNYSRWFSLGGNYTHLNARDNERYVGGQTLQESTTYKVRMPNTPYQFANADAAFFVRNFLRKGNALTVNYNALYVHSFPLYWENHGNKNSKQHVPTQLSHDLSVSYSLNNGRYNFSFECKNFTNEKLYDNFSLQKAGRAFYGKVRYSL